MVITFKSPVASDTTYVGPIGERFLKMMGRSRNVPGAMVADDVPEVLALFKRELKRIEEQEQEAIRAQKARSAGSTPDKGTPDRDKDEDPPEQPVSIANRAYPLIQLLEKSAAAECEVMWE